jgi:hypothetical protein
VPIHAANSAGRDGRTIPAAAARPRSCRRDRRGGSVGLDCWSTIFHLSCWVPERMRMSVPFRNGWRCARRPVGVARG